MNSMTEGPTKPTKALYLYLGGSLLSLALLLPFSRIPGPTLPGVPPLFCSGSFICESITAALLLSRYNESRRLAFLLLALGSIYAASVSVAMLLSFPDALLRNEPLIGGNTDFAAWVFQLWAWSAAAFPLAAAITEDREGSSGKRNASSVLGLAPLALPLVPLAAGVMAADAALVDGGQWTRLNLILTAGSYLAIIASVGVHSSEAAATGSGPALGGGKPHREILLAAAGMPRAGFRGSGEIGGDIGRWPWPVARIGNWAQAKPMPMGRTHMSKGPTKSRSWHA